VCSREESAKCAGGLDIPSALAHVRPNLLKMLFSVVISYGPTLGDMNFGTRTLRVNKWKFKRKSIHAYDEKWEKSREICITFRFLFLVCLLPIPVCVRDFLSRFLLYVIYKRGIYIITSVMCCLKEREKNPSSQ